MYESRRSPFALRPGTRPQANRSPHTAMSTPRGQSDPLPWTPGHIEAHGTDTGTVPPLYPTGPPPGRSIDHAGQQAPHFTPWSSITWRRSWTRRLRPIRWDSVLRPGRAQPTGLPQVRHPGPRLRSCEVCGLWPRAAHTLLL